MREEGQQVAAGHEHVRQHADPVDRPVYYVLEHRPYSIKLEITHVYEQVYTAEDECGVVVVLGELDAVEVEVDDQAEERAGVKVSVAGDGIG